jgi:hypothetical protein
MMQVPVLSRTGTVFVIMQRRKLAAACAIMVLILCTTRLVYATGGVRFSYLHLMYLSIVLAGMAFGAPGGLAAAVLAGLALGPFMPINTGTGEMQHPVN